MIYYIELSTGRYPVKVEDLCEQLDVQPEDLSVEFVLSKGYSPVIQTPIPACSFEQMPMEAKPVANGDGTHRQVWIVVSRFASQQERAAEIQVLKVALKAEVTEKRWRVENGGVTLPNGVKIKTDRESQAQLNSAFTCLKNGIFSTTPWKAEGEVWIDVGLAEIEPIVRVVAQHVNACFAVERQHHAQIESMYDPSALLAYDYGTNWPLN